MKSKSRVRHEKKAEVKATKKDATLEGQALEEIPEEVIIESLKTLTREEKLRQASTSNQVPDEVVIEVVKAVSEEELQKQEFDERVQSVLETNVEIFSTLSTKRDIELQPTMV